MWGNSAVYVCSFYFVQTMCTHTHIHVCSFKETLGQTAAYCSYWESHFTAYLIVGILAESLILLKSDFALVYVMPVGTSHLREFVKYGQA